MDDLLERHVWLYTQGDVSIRITRNLRGRSLVVCGPGSASETQTFPDLAALDAFLHAYLTRLEEDGWVRHATVDRRREPTGPPPDATNRRRRTP